MSVNRLNDLIVSVCMITYNHEKYIRNAVEGVLIQQTDFSIELIIGEDCSTDHTRQICLEYRDKYPNIVKVLMPEQNLGVQKNLFGTLDACRGKYIAFCEGDDYWTDPLKLQKQIDFLETHPEYVYSCHRFEVLEEKTGRRYLSHNRYFDTYSGATLFSFSQNYAFFTEWITQTLTSVIRREAINMGYSRYFEYYRDVHIVYDVLSKGKGVCHSFSGAVMCKNANGVFSHLPKVKQLEINYKVFKELYLHERSWFSRKLFKKAYAYWYIYREPSKMEELPFGLLKCEVLLFIVVFRVKEKIKKLIR